jgi:alpha-beta hydrolase superfamily lysophospholipase
VAVVFHGMAGHGEFFVVLAERLAHLGVAVVAMDYRGHGLSDAPTRRGDFRAFREIMADGMAGLAVAGELFPGLPLVVVAESMGGAVATNLVSQAQEIPTYRGQILFAPAVGIKKNAGGTREIARMAKTILVGLVCPSARSFDTRGNEATGIANPTHQRYDIEDPLHLSHVSLRYLYQLNKGIQQGRRAGGVVRRPTLAMIGDQDPAIDRSAVEEYVASIPEQVKKAFWLIPGARHAMLTDPAFEPFWPRVLEWIRELIGSGESGI